MSNDLTIGTRVKHPAYGNGIILDNAMEKAYCVVFKNHGEKFIEKNLKLFDFNDFSTRFNTRNEKINSDFDEIDFSLEEPEPLEDPSIKNGIFFPDTEFQLKIQQLRTEALYLFLCGHQKTIRGFRQKFVLELEKALEEEALEIPPRYKLLVSQKIRDKYKLMRDKKEKKIDNFIEKNRPEIEEYKERLANDLRQEVKKVLGDAHPRFVERHIEKRVEKVIIKNEQEHGEYHDLLKKIIADYPEDPRLFIDKLLGLNDKQVPVLKSFSETNL
jgi:hypothetical protein